MNYWLDLLQVQGEIKRKWRRWHLQRYMSSDTKYQHPSIGSSINFSTQITMLTRCSPKTHRGSSSCHDDLSSIWVRAAATSMKLAERDVQNIRRKKTEDKNKKTKKKTHTPFIYISTVGGWHDHSFYCPRRVSHPWRTITLSWFSARVQVDPCTITADAVDAYHVALTSGDVRCHVLMGLGEPSKCENAPSDPQSGAITPWLKTTPWIFCGSKQARRPIKEVRNPLFSVTGEARMLWGRGDRTHLKIAKAFLR